MLNGISFLTDFSKTSNTAPNVFNQSLYIVLWRSFSDLSVNYLCMQMTLSLVIGVLSWPSSIRLSLSCPNWALASSNFINLIANYSYFYIKVAFSHDPKGMLLYFPSFNKDSMILKCLFYESYSFKSSKRLHAWILTRIAQTGSQSLPLVYCLYSLL